MLLYNRAPLERRCWKPWTAAAVLGTLALLGLCSAVRLDADEKKPAAPKKEAPPAANKTAEKPAAPAETLHYTGRVMEKGSSKPIAGATVTVRRSLLGDPELKERNPIMEETKHQTDAEGKYSFTIPPEQTAKKYLYIELDVVHPNYPPRKHFGYALSMIRKNEKMGGRPFFEKVYLIPGAAITGTLRVPDGNPAVGVKVQSFSVPGNGIDSFRNFSFADCRTDAQGHFRLVVATPGTAVFWVLPEKFILTVHRVKEGQRGDLGTFSLLPGPTLRGKVLDVRGQPVVGVNVNVTKRGQSEELQGLPVADSIARSAVSDAKGEFVTGPLPPGEYVVQPGDFPRDSSRDDRKTYRVPGVFLPQKVVLKGDAPNQCEVREVPHVVIEAQYYDSKGKKSRGHEPHVFGQIEKEFWFGEAKVDPNGKVVIRVPHGLENVQLSLMTNEHGALRYRKAKGEPLTYGRQINLGTLNDDVRGIEIIRYVAPIAIVKVTVKDGMQPAKLGVSALYKKKSPDGRFILANGVNSDVYFQKQADGRYRTSQLLPDEDFTVTAQAEGYAPRSTTLRLPEGETREVELVLEKAPAKKAPGK
jgi:hypothetical protein